MSSVISSVRVRVCGEQDCVLSCLCVQCVTLSCEYCVADVSCEGAVLYLCLERVFCGDVMVVVGKE